MARRRRTEDPVNHERWLVSYADFITLLFAFFVVMYAISSVNEGKYRVLSDTLNRAFHDPTQSLDPIQIGEVARSQANGLGETDGQSVIETPLASPNGSAENADSPEDVSETAQLPPADEMFQIAEDIRFSLKAFIDKGLVDVRHNPYWVEVDMKSRMLFESGSAKLSRDALRALRGVIGILQPLPNAIHMEGYTDNVPISTQSFPSNWELSAARAASVVHFFSNQGIEPSRLAAIGYGEHRPIAANDTEDGRQQNRRVSMIIMSNGYENTARRLGSRSRER